MAILRDHAITGTVGNTVSGESFTSITGTPTYATGGIGGGQCAEITNDVTEYMQDNLTAEYDAFYIWIDAAPTGDNSISTALVGATHTAAFRMHTARTIGIYSGLTTLVDTSTTVLDTVTWYRIERRIGTATQEVRLYTEAGSTPLETLTGATGVATLPDIHRWGHPHTGARLGAVKIDRIVLADDWPNLGTITGTGAPAATAATAAGAGTASLSGAGTPAAPEGTATGAGTVALTGTGAATAPAATAAGAGDLSVTGVGAATAPDQEADGAGTLTTSGAGSATAPAGEASGSGDVGSTVSGDGAATAAAGSAAGSGSVSLAGTGAATAAAGEAAGTGSLAVTGAGQAEAAPGIASGFQATPYVPAGLPVAATIPHVTTAVTIPHTSTAVTEDA